MISLSIAVFVVAVAGLFCGLACPALAEGWSHLALPPLSDGEPEEWPGLAPFDLMLELSQPLGLSPVFIGETDEPERLDVRTACCPDRGWVSPAWVRCTVAQPVRSEEDWALEVRCAGSLPGAKPPGIEALIAARRAYLARLEASGYQPAR